jgi:hypothetical protein
MPKSLARRVLKGAMLIAPWALAVGLAIGWGLSAWVPGYLERLVPELARDMGLPVTQFHIRDAGLFSADIGPVQLGPEGQGMRLESVRVTYTPASLKLGRVNQIVIRGAAIPCSLDGTTFRLPILDALAAAKAPGEPKAATGPGALPALPFDELVIEDSAVTLTRDGTPLSIPFAATVTPGDPLRVSASLSVRDQRVELEASLGPTLDDLALSATTRGFRLAAVGDLLPLALGGALDLDLTAALNLSRPEGLTATATATLAHADFSSLGATLADDTLRARVSRSEGQTTLALDPLALARPAALTLSVPEATLTGDALRIAFTLAAPDATPAVLPGTLAATRTDNGWDVNLTVEETKSLRVNAGQRTATLGGLSLSLHGTVAPGAASVTLKAATRSCALDGTLTTGPVSLDLPLAYPFPARHHTGRLSVAAMRSGRQRLGALSAAVWQENLGVRCAGVFDAAPLPGLRAPFSGGASLEDRTASLLFSVDDYALPDGFDPGTLSPAMAGVRLGGVLNAEGGVRFEEGALASRLGLFVTRGSMTFGIDGVRIDGMRLYFESPDLLNFRSDPAQMLAFDRLSAGQIEMTNGVITFQVEPGGVVLVERARFDWCGGHLESRAFRVVPGHDEYDATLYCTNLKLTELLLQLGLATARGDSALSGELPVTWKNGKITFNEGFLHSTPGQSGVIQVEGLERLLAAIPEGTAERNQLELARAAMKDFEYSWIRLRADSVGDDLLMRLSVDGKPAGLLPFVYRKDLGGFVKVEGDFKGSNFQGLRLDVNFTLPLDHILLYKDVIGRIE